MAPSPKAKKKKQTEKEKEVELKIPDDEYIVQQTPIQPEKTRPQPLRVYINIEDMKKLKLMTGDFIFVRNPHSDSRAFGIAWPSVAIHKSKIQIGKILIENAGLEPGSTARLEQCSIDRTTDLDLVRIKLNGKLPTDKSFPLYFKEVLIELEYTVNGQLFEISYSGNVFKANLFIDDGVIGRITRNTKINFIPEKKVELGNVGYKSIGGLKESIDAIRDMVQVPLRNPENFTKYGFAPPKGLLLYGPPGTGKTLIARAVAAETGAHVIIINGPEIVSKYYGETEAKLKDIFEEAAVNAPSIIFIDEIDSICPKRDDSQSELEKRIVTCMLTLMDGADDLNLQDRPRVFIIAATNRPDSLDPALRRPGRFDREFEIGIPNADARYEILRTICSKVHHNLTDEEFHQISLVAHGYVGADLAAVVREAGLKAIQRVEKNHLEEDISGDKELIIQYPDMIDGLANVRPSVVREIMLEVPKVYWHEIGGQDSIKSKLKEAVEWPLKHPEKFLKFNIKPPKGLLLYGPPGCSKTLMAKALATEAGLNFMAVKGPELFSKWVGESEKAVQQIFKKARAASPSIIFFDEIDALAVRRAGSESSVADRVLSQLLSEMDGIEPLVNVTIVAATNRPDILDSALLRPGRIDSILYVSPPDLPSRKTIFELQLKKIPASDDVDPFELALMTKGFSGAETVAVCQSAALLAMEESLDAVAVDRKHFVNAIRQTTKRITPEMLQFYDNFRLRSGLRSI
ncbi:spermatogenesis associated protein 5 [Boothiomyces macroporosus]|uniref:Spermatogenesis associated protein 5 n=1 Tax=Boothiomyces macroporosus TaxID=261099 RepID=A0AAD5Y115_9FUNG|nr:spermatogenesis associated protein 5 [Boothiomyces macroporosus]